MNITEPRMKHCSIISNTVSDRNAIIKNRVEKKNITYRMYFDHHLPKCIEPPTSNEIIPPGN
jgi:hypothetical protein